MLFRQEAGQLWVLLEDNNLHQMSQHDSAQT